jgi:hypothetical protein
MIWSCQSLDAATEGEEGEEGEPQGAGAEPCRSSLSDLNKLHCSASDRRVKRQHKTWSHVARTTACSKCASRTRRTISMPPRSRVLFCTSWSTNQLMEAKALHATCPLPRPLRSRHFCRRPCPRRSASLSTIRGLPLRASRKAKRRIRPAAWQSLTHLHQVSIEGVGVHGGEDAVDPPPAIHGQAADPDAAPVRRRALGLAQRRRRRRQEGARVHQEQGRAGGKGGRGQGSLTWCDRARRCTAPRTRGAGCCACPGDWPWRRARFGFLRALLFTESCT